MTREETKTVLAMIATVYPKNLLSEITDMTVNVWYELLKDLPYDVIQAATTAWLTTNRYPPTISDLRGFVFREVSSNNDTPEQEWNKIVIAIQKYGHTQRERAREYLGDLWEYMSDEWNYYCKMLETEMPYEKNRFIKRREVAIKREREQMQIPSVIREKLAMIGAGEIKKIGAGE